jgi:flagellar biosynthesis GTPase FlhF
MGLTLVEALAIAEDDVVALVGGGGKTTTMFRLAREIVARGGYALTTTTARIFAAQITQAMPRGTPSPRRSPPTATSS